MVDLTHPNTTLGRYIFPMPSNPKSAFSPPQKKKVNTSCLECVEPKFILPGYTSNNCFYHLLGTLHRISLIIYTLGQVELYHMERSDNRIYIEGARVLECVRREDICEAESMKRDGRAVHR